MSQCTAIYYDSLCYRELEENGTHKGAHWDKGPIAAEGGNLQWFTDDCYESLEKLLGDKFPADFPYMGDYVTAEKEMLKPLIEALGFTRVGFTMGEQDSFGPLTRVACATDKDGLRHRFVYG